MSRTLDDIIESLPEEWQAWAKQYGTALLNFSDSDIMVWIKNITEGNWLEAYEALAHKMTTAQLLKSQKAINKTLIMLNDYNATVREMQRQMVLDAMVISLALLKAAI